MPKFKTVITTVGAAKIAAVLAGTGSIVLNSNARMAVGDGNGTLPTPDPAQTALVKEVYRAALNTASIDASNPKNIIAELIIPPDKGGFWMREMALYDAAGTLLAVGNMAETYKPSLSEGAGRKQVIRMVIAVSDVTAVTITMDSSTVMATQDYVDNKLSDHEKSRKHPDATLTDKGFTQLSSETNSVSETKAATPKAVKTVMDAVTTKAPTVSPALTGTPTAPTAPADTNTTQLATTAFVVAALARLVNSSPAVLDTLGELAAALGNDPNFATTMTTALANKQPLDATLTALAGLANSANKLPYFTGADQMATADLSAFIRTMLGKADAAAVLQYLGLAYFADKNSSNEQLFNGLVASKKGVSAASSDGNRRVNLFVSETGYELIVYIDGKYNNSIQIPTRYGTMALLDDVSNSVQSAPPPIGIPFLWPLSAMPNTVVPEWASNVFLKMNDATFSASTYPALARVWPGLKLTDCRGEFLRIWDDGRGVDSGRALLSAQGDAIRNITGNIGVYTDGLLTYASGAFSLGPASTNKNNPIAGSGANAYARLDVSTVVPTATENRPRNVAFNLLVRAK
ncbi:phage tail protein [Citrobacter portucalensis]|uniref:phage tail protein n=1 Tax=Citrobacter portucalensis TaxID=1639133 RepID=UPI00226B210B|nr:phage tail protein [Citrobacter portucalensis]MCX9067657.1 phage tail protein [Citrobacter portucalensis]